MGLRNLDLGLLRTFTAVAERESFAVAAETVFRSQAAVSQQMQRLESVLGCTLFVRIGRNKRLTDQGARLLEYAKRIMSLNDEACRAMAQDVFAIEAPLVPTKPHRPSWPFNMTLSALLGFVLALAIKLSALATVPIFKL